MSSPSRSLHRVERLLRAGVSIAAVVSVCLAASCSGADAPACEVGRPTACPSPEPSWKTQVEPIIKQSCAPCHFPGGQAIMQGSYDFSTLGNFSNAPRTTIESDLESCKMPLAGGNAPLSGADADTIIEWLLCGAPNN